MVREILGPKSQNNCDTYMMIGFMIGTAQQVLFR